MACSFTDSWRSTVIALIIAFIFAFSLAFSSSQRYIELDVTFPATSWLHLYASVGGEASQFRYKGMKVTSSGKPAHVRLPLSTMPFDALLIRMERPGGSVAISDIRIVSGSGDIVSSIQPGSIETSASGNLAVLPGKVLLTPTGLSETLDIRINIGEPLPPLPKGVALYFLRMFLLGGVVSIILAQGLRLVVRSWGKYWLGDAAPTGEHVPESRPAGRQLHFLTAGLFLVILGLRLSLIRAFGSDLPFWDQWDAEAANLYIPYFNGALSMGDLFAAHNEHRILLTRLASLGLLLLNGKWDPLLQMVFNSTIYAAVGVFVFRSMLPAAGRIVWSGFVVLIFSLPFGWQNTLGGFQLQFYLVAGLSLLFLWVMTCADPGWRRWTAGVSCAVLLLFTMASGFLACIALLLPVIAAVVKGRGAHRLSGRRPVFLLCIAVVVAGLLLKAEVPEHLLLKADSSGGFAVALAAYLGWPLTVFPLAVPGFSWPLAALFFSALLLWLPFLIFLRDYLISDRPTGKMEFIAGAAFWVILQAAATAYARGGMVLPPSRYQDIFALGLLINFAALLSFRQAEYAQKRGWVTSCVALLWILGTAGGLIYTTGMNVIHDLPEKRSQQQASLEHVQEFMASGNIGVLSGRPKYDVPHPDQQKLAILLNNDHIRRVLSTTVTGSVDKGRLRILLDWLLAGSTMIVLSGLVCCGIYIRLVVSRKTAMKN